jgi:hypothetical protein
MVVTAIPGSALIRLRIGFVRALEDTAPELTAGSSSAAELRDVAEEALSLPGQVRRTWETLRHCGLVGEPDVIERLGQSLREYCEGALRVLRSLGATFRQLGANGTNGDLPSRFAAAAGELEQLRDDIFARWPKRDRQWPPLDREMVAESRQFAEQGSCERAADVPR